MPATDAGLAVRERTLPGGINLESADYYADGARYDAEYVHIRHDVPYYASVAADTQGRVLELACGTGRLTIPMAQAGASVLGVDISGGMIARANEKREALPPGDQARLRFMIGDMRDIRLGEAFAAVVLAFNTLMHMIEDEDLARVLDTVRAHLVPGGFFHVDLHLLLPDAPPRDPAGRYDPQEMIDPRTRERFIVTENNTYNPRTQINAQKFYFQRVDLDGKAIGEETCSIVELRMLYPRELDRWLHLHGFEIAGDWDDFERKKPFSATGGRRVLMARRRS